MHGQRYLNRYLGYAGYYLKCTNFRAVLIFAQQQVRENKYRAKYKLREKSQEKLVKYRLMRSKTRTFLCDTIFFSFFRPF